MQGCPGGAVHMVGLARSTSDEAGEVCFGRVHKVFAVCVSEEVVLAPWCLMRLRTTSWQWRCMGLPTCA